MPTFYSNCLLECLKALFRSGFKAEVVDLSFCSALGHAHYGWRLNGRTFHFCSEAAALRPWWKNIVFRRLVSRLFGSLIFNEKDNDMGGEDNRATCPKCDFKFHWLALGGTSTIIPEENEHIHCINCGERLTALVMADGSAKTIKELKELTAWKEPEHA